MTAYGILVVQPGWKEGDRATIDRTTVLRHGDVLKTGTRLLFYMKEPVDAIVAQGEMTADAVQPNGKDGEPDSILTHAASPPTAAATETRARETPPVSGVQPVDHRTYELPYRLTRPDARTQPISLPAVQAQVGSAFSVFDEEWIPLTEAQYNALIREWERTP